MSNTEIIKKLKSLKDFEAGGRPQEAWVRSSKEILLSQIEPQVAKGEAIKSSFYYYNRFIADVMTQKVLRPALAALLIVTAFFGYTATVTVANASLPGDMLYPIKTTMEQTQLALTFDNEKKVQLQMTFVTRRVDELQQIVKKDDTPQVKTDKVVQAVRKISADVKSVKDNLNKVVTSPEAAAEAIQTAKEVDDKTLKAEKDIVDAHASLPDQIKKDVADDVKDAIINTEEAGVKALGVIVEKGKDEKSNISETEITNRVADRIKSSENSLEAAVNEVNKSASGTIAIISTTTLKVTTSTLSSTSADMIANKPIEAAQAIEDAKDLLDKKDFSSALVKIQESKTLVGEMIANAPVMAIVPVTTSSTSTIPVSSTGTSKIITTSTESTK